MPGYLYTHIKQLAGISKEKHGPLRGAELKKLESIENAWLYAVDGKIHSFGSMKDLPDLNNVNRIDCTDQVIIPGWCDSHTHLVFAATREEEFVDRINGLSYQEIASRGGGILNSAAKLASCSEDELVVSAMSRLHEVIAHGTVAIEIKSGYGLDVANELKMLRVIQRIKQNSPIPVRVTLLAAHAVPLKYKENKKEYIDLILNELIPEVGRQRLADYCDVFCEENYFTPEESTRILEAGKKAGLIPKVHANQLAQSGGVQVGVNVGAVSVDHLEYVFEPEIEALKNSTTIATILPGAQFFLQLPFPPAREMLNHNIALAIASDYNPGSSPSGNMCFMNSLACVNYKLNPEEAINASTINGAFAMHLENEVGSITIGKKANFIVLKKNCSYNFIAYSFANNVIDKVVVNGSVHITH